MATPSTDRYILETAVLRFQEKLRDGWLNAKQEKAATRRLYEACDALDDFDWEAIQRLRTGPVSPPTTTGTSGSA